MFPQPFKKIRHSGKRAFSCASWKMSFYPESHLVHAQCYQLGFQINFLPPYGEKKIFWNDANVVESCVVS